MMTRSAWKDHEKSSQVTSLVIIAFQSATVYSMNMMVWRYVGYISPGFVATGLGGTMEVSESLGARESCRS